MSTTLEAKVKFPMLPPPPPLIVRFPLPSNELPFIVLRFVPLTSSTCPVSYTHLRAHET